MPGEKFLADGMYRGAKAETPTGLNNFDQRMKGLARARHETFNSRLKRFGALNQSFRHGVDKHGSVLYAVANICQIEIEEESPLFQVWYNDRLSPNM